LVHEVEDDTGEVSAMALESLRSRYRVRALALQVTAAAEAPAPPQLPRVAPEEVGLSKERLARLDDFFRDAISGRAFEERPAQQQCLAGCVLAVARHGRLCHSSVLGQRDLKTGEAMTEDTIFRIASMTKIVTAVAALQLYEQGLFQLDDPIHMFIPAFKDAKVKRTKGVSSSEPLHLHITIRHLFTHTSGLGKEGGKSEHSLAEHADFIARKPLEFQPGKGFEYGTSTNVLGRLVEILSGQSLDRYFQTHIFRPLGMKDTGFWVPEEHARRLATLYVAGKDGQLRPALAEDWLKIYIGCAPRFLSPGGGLYSTATDFMRLGLMLAGKGALGSVRILGRKTVELMTKNHMPFGQDIAGLGGEMPDFKTTRGLGCGLGVFVVLSPEFGVHCSEGTYFWQGIASTYFFHDPVEALTVVAMAQFDPVYGKPVFNINFALRSLTEQAIVD